MKTFNAILFAALAITAAQPALAAAEDQAPATTAASATTTAPNLAIRRGQILYAAAGHVVAPVYRLTAAGEPQVMVDERLVTVPAATLSLSGTKLATSLSVPELRRLGR